MERRSGCQDFTTIVERAEELHCDPKWFFYDAASMFCPSCQQPLTESTAACACGFCLSAADRAYGLPPSLHSGVTDMMQELTAKEVRRVEAEIARLERKFPQIQFAVTLCPTPAVGTLRTYAFWLFNRAGIAAAVDRGAQNRLVLLCIDPAGGKAVCMIGYGLEPFVGEQRLSASLNAAFAGLASDTPGQGIEDFLAEMEKQLTEAAGLANRAFQPDALEYQGLVHLQDTEAEETAAY